MAYKFLSNISDFNDFNNIYVNASPDDEIIFKDIDNIPHKAHFLMIRAHSSNDLLLEILPYGYGVYVPSNEMWSVDSINDINGFKIKKAFQPGSSNEITSNIKFQWMIGYK
jgi:hypothetical protein